MDRQTYGWNDLGAPCMMNRDYVETVRLILRVMPSVFSTGVFAMKGGTAINLFLTDMPRLSVDIDVVFLPVRLTRDEALSAIAEELRGIRANLASTGLVVRGAHSADPLESQLLINNGDCQVKVEVNTVFRGSLMDVGRHSLDVKVSEMFATEVAATLLAPPEIYVGKIMAALDRQHPRDLFDIWHLYQGDGLTNSMLDAFPVYLAGHNRPPNEVLNGKNKNIEQLYESALVGMTRDEAPTVETLTKIRSRLRADVISGLSVASREFLRGFFELEPDWSLLPYKNAQDLPALQWKLTNLKAFRKNRPEKFKSQNTELTRLLTLDPHRDSNFY